MKNNFIHLRLHSTYSMCEGALKVEKIIELCEQNKMPAVAITDTNNLFGCMEFSVKAAKHGIQPIIGCQVNVRHPSDNHDQSHLRLYAKSQEGYYNLMQIVTDSHIHSCSSHAPCVDISVLEKYSHDLIALSGGIYGSVGRLLISHKRDEAVKVTKDFLNIFSDKLYIEISRHNDRRENEIEEDLINIAYDFNIPLVGTNNVCFAEKDDMDAHDVLICIGQSTTVNDQDRIFSSPEYYFKSQEEMSKIFEDLPEAVYNTMNIAQRCAFRLVPRKPFMPEVKTEDGLTQDEQLEKMTKEGLEKRLEKFKNCKNFEEIRKKYSERMEYELSVIQKMRFSGYFLIVSDYVQWAKSHDIPVGLGRGSGAGSIVAYALTITNVDPLRFNLLFERFLNPERVSMPDFDIDFCQSRREEVINYVQKHYGFDSVAQIITFGQLQARAVIKDAGRALGLPYGLTDKISKMVPFIPTNPMTLSQAIEAEKPLRDAIAEDYEIQRLINIALKLEGLCKHTSVHAAGVVISDRKIRDLVPLYKDPKASMQVTQFSMKYIEDAGLIKFDFLGLKTLTVIKKAIDLLKKKGIYLAADELPLDDRKTFELIQNIDCVGIFQCESGGMRDVIKRLKPDKVEDIIAIIALYRPGPMENIPKYIACKHGVEEIEYEHPSIEPILAETYGIMVYQEQVMQIAQVVGGYSLGQADILRRAMGKKNKEEMAKQEAKFIEGAKANNIDESTAKTLFALMNKFAGYGFNKSHAVCYGLLTYQTAYLKANHLLEFFAAIMTLDMDNTDKLAIYYADLQKSKVKVIPPNVNISCDDFVIDYEQNAIIYSLSALKGVGKQVAISVEEERKKRPFKSVFDFIERMQPYNVLNKKTLEALIKSGSFDELNNNRHKLLASIDILLNTEKETDQFALFEKTEPKLANVEEFHTVEKLSYELESVGMYISAHPIDDYLQKMNDLGCSDISESNQYMKCRIAGVITSVQKKNTKNDTRFAIINLSDKSGNVDIMIFSELFLSCYDLLVIGRTIVIDVNVQKNDEGLERYTAANIYELNENLHLPKFELFIGNFLSSKTKNVFVTIEDKEDLGILESAIRDFAPGSVSIELNIKKDSKKIRLKNKFKISIREILSLKQQLGADKINND